MQCFEVSIINVLKRKITKNLSLVKNLPIFTNHNARNLVLSCLWSTTINLFLAFQEGRENSSSETQGQSVGSGKKEGRKFSSKCGRAPGYRLSTNYFQKFKLIPAPDWAQKMLCIIVPNRRTVAPEFFS